MVFNSLMSVCYLTLKTEKPMKFIFLTGLLGVVNLTSSIYAADSFHPSHENHNETCEGFLPLELTKGPGIPSTNYLNEGITKEEFDERNSLAKEYYTDFAKKHNATLVVNEYWDDEFINASAGKSGSHWEINMYGGLARVKGMTADAFSSIVCHELGHLVAGFPFYPNFPTPLTIQDSASEGNSDYFAAQACFVRMFENDKEGNQKAEDNSSEFVKQTCENAHSDKTRQQICMRAINGAQIAWQAVSDHYNMGLEISPEKKDTRVAYTTIPTHPQLQCRMDTFVAGATCTKSYYKDNEVPLTQADMEEKSCSRSQEGDAQGARPLCWFNPKKVVTEDPVFGDIHFSGIWENDKCQKSRNEGQFTTVAFEFSRPFEGKGVLTEITYTYLKNCERKNRIKMDTSNGTYSFGLFDTKTHTRTLDVFLKQRSGHYVTRYTTIEFVKDTGESGAKRKMRIATATREKDGSSAEKRSTEFNEKSFNFERVDTLDKLK